MKLFIFDMGGVVANNVTIIPLMAESFGIGEADFFLGAGSDPAATHTSPYHLGDIAALMRGELSSAEFWENFSRRTGIAVRGDPWYDCFRPELNSDTAALVAGLRKKGRRVVCGTNTLEAHFRRHEERGDYRLFDRVYASHIMGIIKPDPAFWRFILKEEGAPPEETFFADDLAENVEAARKLGIGAHLFTGAGELAETLKSLEG
ncbi:MAG: HAD family phosphatase [Treponema sp.]|jgi:putative hydrolase of the HAD superfamily|nr:HAD family phosphatase [Treponema sp.]